MAFCRKCGAKNKAGAAFCTQCGAPLTSRADKKKSDGISPGDRHKQIGMIAAAAVTVILIILVFFLFGGRSYKKVVKEYVNAVYSADAKKFVSLVPDKVWDYTLEEEGYDKDEEDLLIEELEDMLWDSKYDVDDVMGKNWKVSCAILADEDVTGRDLKEVKDAYEETEVKISGAKIVEAEITVTGEETEVSETQKIPVIKVGRSWYLDVEGL